MPPAPEASGSTQKLQLLGLAFAGADLIFEIDTKGLVTFALGAGEQLTGRASSALIGADWADLVTPEDGDLLEVLLEGLKPGERKGPVRVALRARPGDGARRFASLAIFRLPLLQGHVSCSMSLGAPLSMDHGACGADGLVARETFTETATALLEEAEKAGLNVRLDLIEMNGLDAAVAAMDSAAAAKTRRQVAATLRAESYGGLGASEVAPDKFAVLRTGASHTEALTRRLGEVAGPGVRPVAAELALEAGSPAQNLRAMRFALDRYIEQGAEAASSGFMEAVRRTVQDSARFRSMMATGAFELVYQPVVDLADETLHHFEALARFDRNASPYDTIRLAEELGMITDFDLSVVKSVVKVLFKARPNIKIAANVSALSLMKPSFIEALIAVTAFDPGLRPRLLIEVTETKQLNDLPQANAVLASLRKLGHVVCLDDFGAGAASLDYLRLLDVDFVKIDGRFVKSMDSQPRDEIVLKHVVAMCQEMGVATIAEMIETRDTATKTRALGVRLGQGWHFGKPTAEPVYKAPPPAVRARRVGETVSWG